VAERRGAAGRAGFTLLEVLAAVAIFGLVFTALASVSMQWIAAEGDNARRLRASLLADAVLADLEAQLAGGAAPAVGETEEERDGFRVRIEVTPFEAPPGLLPGAEQTAPVARSRTAAANAPTLFGGDPARPGPLRTIRIHVIWQEGVSDRSVTRTTWGLDREAAGQILSQAGVGQQEGSPGPGSPR